MVDGRTPGGASRWTHGEIGVHGDADHFPTEEQPDERTILQLSTARPAARRGDAEAGHRRSYGALVLVCREVRFERYHRLLSVSLKHPCPRHRRGRAADNSMLNELVGRHRNAMAYEIIGRGHDNARD